MSEKTVNEKTAKLKTTIEEKFAEVLMWMEETESDEKEEYDEKQKSVEAVATPIITNMY